MAHDWYPWYLIAVGRTREPVGAMQTAMCLDPLSVIINFDYGAALRMDRRPDEAEAQFRKTLELDPKYEQALGGMVEVALQTGRAAEVIPSLEQTRVRLPIAQTYLARAYAQVGRVADARRVLAELDRLPDSAMRPELVADVYIALSDFDRALPYLESALDARSPGVTLMKSDPLIDPIRKDSRFIALLKKAGL